MAPGEVRLKCFEKIFPFHEGLGLQVLDCIFVDSFQKLSYTKACLIT